MITNEAEALNREKDKEELIKELQGLVSKYGPKIHINDISGAMDYVKNQVLAFHFMTAMEMTKKDVDRVMEYAQG